MFIPLEVVVWRRVFGLQALGVQLDMRWPSVDDRPSYVCASSCIVLS